MHLPLLDIHLWRSSPHRFSSSLRSACHTCGLFSLRHRLPPRLPLSLLSSSSTFFSLEQREKQTLCYSRSHAFRGYIAHAVEKTAGVPDLREQLELGPDEPRKTDRAGPLYERLRGRNQWPEGRMPTLRPLVEEYVEHLCALCDELAEAIAMALGLERSALRPILQPAPHWQLKLVRYSAAAQRRGEGEPVGGGSLALGCGAHTDSGFLTLVLQDGSGGLQAWSRGRWVDVPPSGPDVFVCNLGEVAQLVSGGYFLATPHRVLRPARERISVPFFYNPRLDATVEALRLPEGLEWDREPDYESGGGHWVREGNIMLGSYGANAFKSLARSHVDVFRAHHPDLEVCEQGGGVVRAADATGRREVGRARQ